MAINKRVFSSFAIEDVRLRDFLVGQARNKESPFSFVDMSVKEPWSSEWKTNCRRKIKGCDGVIGIVSSNTKKAEGQLWELNCAYEEGIPVLLIYGYKDDRPSALPEPVKNKRILNWSWENISNFLNRL